MTQPTAWCWRALLVVALLAGPVAAQTVTVPTTGITITPSGGVYIDPLGVASMRQTDIAGKLAAYRPDASAKPAEQLGYVSLPRLLADVRAKLQAGQPLTDEQKYLHGLTRLRYIFLDPVNKDLIIAGPTEPLDPKVWTSPIGKKSARPTLQLEDLIVALRTVGPGHHVEPLGCSIDLPAGAMDRFVKQINENVSLPTRQERIDKLVQAVGMMDARYFGFPPDTRPGWVAMNADCRLKRMVLALDPVPGSAARREFGQTGAVVNRMWFVNGSAPLLVSADGNSFELPAQALKVDCASRMENLTAPATPEAKRFAEAMTKDLPKIAGFVPEYADLWNVADMFLLATLFNTDRLGARAGIDVAWFQDPRHYRTAAYPVAKQVATSVIYNNGMYAAGGVLLELAGAAARNNRQVSTNAPAPRVPPAGQWFVSDPDKARP